MSKNHTSMNPIKFKKPLELHWFTQYSKPKTDIILVPYAGMKRTRFIQFGRYQLECSTGKHIKQELLFAARGADWDIVKPACLIRKPVKALDLKPEKGLAKKLDTAKYIDPFIFSKNKAAVPVRVVLRNGVVITCELLSQDDYQVIACIEKALVLIWKHGILSVEPVNKKSEPVSKQPPAKEKQPPTKEKPKPKKRKSTSPISHFTDVQIAEINSAKPQVSALFSERQSLKKAEVVEMLPDVDPKVIGRVLSMLSQEGFLSMRKPKVTPENPDPKVVFRVKKAKPKTKPKPKQQTPKISEILNANDTECLEIAREFLSDGQKIERRQIPLLLMEKHEVSKKSVLRVLRYLEAEKEILHSLEIIDDKKVGFIQLAKDK